MKQIPKEYSKKVVAAGYGDSLTLFITPSAELDDIVEAYCAETGDRLRIKGWMFEFTTVEE